MIILPSNPAKWRNFAVQFSWKPARWVSVDFMCSRNVPDGFYRTQTLIPTCMIKIIGVRYSTEIFPVELVTLTETRLIQFIVNNIQINFSQRA